MEFLLLLLLPFILAQQNSDNIEILKQADPVHTALLYGDVNLGYYYVNIYVGTPPVRQTVIVDTGSAITTFPCNDCGNNCGQHDDPFFQKAGSNTSEIVRCHETILDTQCKQCDNQQRCSFSISYAESSSLAGYYLRDYFLFGDAEYESYLNATKNSTQVANEVLQKQQIKTVFGCTTRETNLFKTQQADGIMGLSPKANNGNALPNIVDDIFKQEGQDGKQLQFALCYNSQSGGYMTVGGYDYHRHDSNAKTYNVPYYDQNGLYRIHLDSVTIGDYKLNVDSSVYNRNFGSFVDSGTTLVYADPIIYNEFLKQLSNYCAQNSGYCPHKQNIYGETCFQYDGIEGLSNFYKRFPPIYFNLENDFVFDWRPEDYLFLETLQTAKPNIYCLPLQSYSERFILGGVWMRSWDILFNRQNKTLSFTRSSCSNEAVHLNPHHTQFKQDDKNETSIEEAQDNSTIKEIHDIDTQNESQNSTLHQISNQTSSVSSVIQQFKQLDDANMKYSIDFIKIMIVCLICGLTLMLFLISRSCIRKTSLKSTIPQEDDSGDRSQPDNHIIEDISKEQDSFPLKMRKSETLGINELNESV